jgi:hypothetical protein
MARTLPARVLLVLACLALQLRSAQAQSEPMPLSSPTLSTPADLEAPELPPPAEVPPAPPASSPNAPSPGSLFGLNPMMGLVPGIPGAVPFPTVGYRVALFPTVPVSGQDTRLGYIEQSLHGSLPLWSDGPSRWSLVGNLRSEIFQTNGTILPDTLRPFPSTLSSIQLGTTYVRQFANGWVGGGSFMFGSASDKPFQSLNVMTAAVSGFLRVPQNEQGAWLFSLMYSPTSQLPVPIPGVAYQWYPNDRFRMNIGVPFQVMYRPTDDVLLEFSYMLITNVHARATYKVAPSLFVHGGYDWQNEGYLLADRTEVNERLYYYDMKLSAGMRYVLGQRTWVDLSSGYLFERFYFQGANLSDRNHDRINLGNGTFIALQLQHRW